MFKRLLVGTAAVIIGTTGLVAVTAGVSGASKPTITAGPGSSVSCNITASVKLSPSLKNDWVAADHSTDPDPAVVALPNTTFGTDGPVIVSLKGSGTCTGTVTDGVNTASVTAVKFTLTNDPAHLGNSSEATCSSLVTGMPPSTAEYDTTISYSSSSAKITPTTITDETIPPASFSTEGGTISGSFAGGTASSAGTPDSTTIGAVTQSAAHVNRSGSYLPTVPADSQAQDERWGAGGIIEGSEGSQEDLPGHRIHAFDLSLRS